MSSLHARASTLTMKGAVIMAKEKNSTRLNQLTWEEEISDWNLQLAEDTASMTVRKLNYIEAYVNFILDFEYLNAQRNL
jgi:hypothetical protein